VQDSRETDENAPLTEAIKKKMQQAKVRLFARGAEERDGGERGEEIGLS